MAEEKRMEIFVPRGAANEEPNVFISVNGVNFLLPRGKKSMVPREIGEEYLRAQAAQDALEERINALTEKAG